jgi:TolA-binding protein
MTRINRIYSIFAAFLVCVSTGTTLNAQTPADQFSEAAGFYSRGQWEDSIAAFETLIATSPGTEQAKEGFFFLGESQLQVSNFRLARIAYQKFLSQMPQSQFTTRANFRLAEISYRTKDKQATTLLEAFIRENQDSDLVQFAAGYLGEARLDRSEPQLAQHVFEKVIRKFPGSTMMDEYRLGLGKSLQMQNRNAEAQNLFEQLLRTGGPKIIEETRMQLGLLAFARSDWTSAIGNFTELKRQAVDNPTRESEATYWLGRCHLELGEYDRAILYFELLSPEQISGKLGPAVFYDGAVAWAHVGRTEEALNWLAQIREHYPESDWGDESLQLEIEIAQRSGQQDSVLDLIERFKSSYPKSELLTSVMESEGRVYYARQDYARTVQIFENLLSRPIQDSVEVRQKRSTWEYFIGLGQIGLKRFEAASKTLAQIDTISQDDSFKAAVAIARGTSLSATGDYNAATTQYRNYLDLQPNGPEAARCLSELAISEAELKNWPQADQVYTKLSGQHSNESYVVNTAAYLANAAYKDDQLSQAARWFEVMIQPGVEKEMVGKGLTGLAWIYLKGGDNQRALEHFERILTEFPDTDFAVDAAMARAKQLEDSKNYDEAAKTYRLVTTRTSQTRLANIARLRIAFCSQKLGGPNNLNAAKMALTEYLQADSDQDQIDEAIYQLAWVYNDLGLPAQGFNQFDRLAKDHPDSKYWADAAYRLAEHRFKKKDFPAAQSLVNQLIQNNDQPEILSRSIFMNGQMAAMRNEWGKVATDMRSLLDRCDDKGVYAKASYWLAESLYQQNDIVAAADLFSQLVSKNDLLNQTVWPWVALRNSQCQAKLEQWENVSVASTEAQTRFADFKMNYEHTYLIGRALEKQGRLVEAREKFTSVVTSTTGGRTETAAKAQWRIGETYFHQKDFKSAIRAFYKVDSLFTYPKWRTAAIYEAGKCQEHLGNWTHATILYEQLLRDFPECDYANEAKQRLELATRQADASTKDVTR